MGASIPHVAGFPGRRTGLGKRRWRRFDAPRQSRRIAAIPGHAMPNPFVRLGCPPIGPELR